MRIDVLVLSLSISSALMAGCCKEACTGGVSVQLAEVPETPYEVRLELPDETVVWTCEGDPQDTDPGPVEFGVDCATGTFQALELELGDRVERASITVGGVTREYAAECEKNKVCRSTCWECSFVVD